MGGAAAAILVILVCLCSASKANLLSKNKEPQQTPATQVSPACRQSDQRCNLAQQILSAQTPHVQGPATLVCCREEAQTAMGLFSVHCWLSQGNWTATGYSRADSPDWQQSSWGVPRPSVCFLMVLQCCCHWHLHSCWEGEMWPLFMGCRKKLLFKPPPSVSSFFSLLKGK